MPTMGEAMEEALAKLSQVELWSDGSGTSLGNPGGWAYILRFEREGEWLEKVGHGSVSSATNNRMELTAVLMGLRALTRRCRVTIFTDSEYVANPFKQNWLEGWQKKRWRKVKNADIWQELVAAAGQHSVTFQWVKGHAGIAHNERCDFLAGEARKLEKERLGG